MVSVNVVSWLYFFHFSHFTHIFSVALFFFMPSLSLSSVLFLFFPVHLILSYLLLSYLNFLPSFIIHPRNMLMVKLNIVHIWSKMPIDYCGLWHRVWIFLFMVTSILSELAASVRISPLWGSRFLWIIWLSLSAKVPSHSRRPILLLFAVKTSGLICLYIVVMLTLSR